MFKEVTSNTKFFIVLFPDACLEPLGFTCDVCNKSYKNRTTLNAHKKYECENLRQFNCPACGAMFNRKHHLNRHVKTCQMFKKDNKIFFY